jgi:predicted transcriptional regulator
MSLLSESDLTMYDLYIVRRTQIYIDESQGERLASIAKRSGTTMSGVIRAAIDAYLERESSEDARLVRFRAAVAETAGIAPGLPPGEEYVDAIRPDYADRARELWGESGD